jgi:hypothetical protein
MARRRIRSVRPQSLLPRVSGRYRGPVVLAALAAGALAATMAAPASAQTASAQTASAQTASAQIAVAAADGAVAQKPYLGWSSWSMQSSKYPGLNPNGSYSYLSEANVLKQTNALASKLKKFGYSYVNIDAGWWMNWDWQTSYDQYGRQAADPVRFPHGMKYVADKIHAQGLKAGIYLPVGLEKPAYGGGTVPIWNAAGCTTADIVYPDLRTTNGWDSSYKIDFSNPCAQKYIDSQAQLLAGWGYDFLKLDGVGPGSGKSGDNYNNVADVAAWKTAIASTGRPIHLELSWSLDINQIADWKANSNGWRIDTDVECYCNTLVTWDNSVDDRFADAPAWTPQAAPGGWNDLDSLDVGNGKMDGLTPAERQSYATLWAIEASPLFTGDDLTKLDDVGLSLLTNRDVIAVDQQGIPARPVTPSGDQQVWGMKNADGSYTVALFNLGDAAANVTGYWTSFGFSGKATVRELWSHQNLGERSDSISAKLPAHGSQLFTVKPTQAGAALTAYEAESPTNTLIGSAGVSGCDACSGQHKVGNLYQGGALTFNGIQATRAGTYQLNVAYTTGDPRSANVSANGGAAAAVNFPPSGGWGTPATITIPVVLKAGANTITIDSGSGYSPDIDAIALPASGSTA